MGWSRPDVQNATRDCSRQGNDPVPAHIKYLHRVMEYYMGTPECEWHLRPSRFRDEFNRNFEFIIKGMPDSDYASVSGYYTLLEDTHVSVTSVMQHIVALSVTEVEKTSVVSCAHDMLYRRIVLMPLELKIKLPMILEID